MEIATHLIEFERDHPRTLVIASRIIDGWIKSAISG
jgi:hypothetical protein